MKTTLQTIVFFVLCVLIYPQVNAQNKLEVKITNIKETTGSLRISLFTSDADFLKKAIDLKVLKVTATEVTMVFTDLKSGDYAVSVIHDKNDNEELDANFMGIPKEPYGFSNNVMGSFGPPSFDRAKMVISDNKSCSISLRE